ncbi:MAG: GNAT family N-acetyltransferase [Candidatus Hydrogenedentes bacterium]|nr:GNAT family N-acetyltransferase [Candidatus Hydrogenedentota bacterium]
MISIQRIREHESIRRCYPIMAQLRPHLDEATFCARVKRQFETQCYHLVALESEGTLVSLAGYRFLENLIYGPYLYVDDLITDTARRGQGFGGQLFDWLVEEARREGVRALHLDSGVQRFDAHRFYLGKSMEITSRHFGLQLQGG